MKNNKTWLTSAHRGFVDDILCENSLAAYYNAYLNGADMIETDARLTSDGVLIVNHDGTITADNGNGEKETYIIAETPSETICSIVLSNDEKWGTQYVPTLEQVLNLAYNTGLIVNIDLKNGYKIASQVAKMVLKCGMQGRVIYALNGCALDGINTILAIDPDARFIDYSIPFAESVKDFPERGKRCFCYHNTNLITEDIVSHIRDCGCRLALISINEHNFEKAIKFHPDMCEFLHTSDFKTIESDYFNHLKLY